MDDCSFGSIVRRLQLRNIDYMRAHTRGGNETSQLEILQPFAIQVRPLHLLASPVEAGGVSTVIHAVHIGRHDVLVMFDLTVEKVALRPWNAGICNQNVEAAIEFFHNVVNHLFDVLLASNVYLVCST